MTREYAEQVEVLLREYYNDRTGEVQLPEIIVDGEDVSHLYEKLFSTEYLDTMPDLKVNIPIIPRIAKKQAVDLILEIYKTYKAKHECPFVK